MLHFVRDIIAAGQDALFLLQVKRQHEGKIERVKNHAAGPLTPMSRLGHRRSSKWGNISPSSIGERCRERQTGLHLTFYGDYPLKLGREGKIILLNNSRKSIALHYSAP